jgi:3'-phosphoadenosine 5'-phosphosulfate sulfotransferase (PAPS reductase)/FAD synthetase
MKHTIQGLRQLQSLSLEQKIEMSKRRIRQFYEHYKGDVYVAFSGGKDSTVLLHLVRSVYPDIPAVFVDAGLEYPEIKDFVKTQENIIILKPKMNFTEVIKVYGYPMVSKKVARMIRDLKNPNEKNKATRRLYLEGIKRNGTKTKFFKLPKKWYKLIDAPFKISEQCCLIMKKKPIKEYERHTKRKSIVGLLASDSDQRRVSWLRTGCNNWKAERSLPLAFWTTEDVWNYIKKFKVPYCKIYDMGEHNTGCIYCMFGVQLEKEPNRFQRMKSSHPQLYNYCMNQLNLKKCLDYIGVDF